MGQGDGRQVEWLDDLVDSVRAIHEWMLEVGGGAQGEHTASLHAACARPFHSIFGEPAYGDVYGQAAALMHAIICDHVFVDGNKRTGTGTAALLLASFGVLEEFDAQRGLKLALLGQVALAAASGQLDVAQVTFWIRRSFEPEAQSGSGRQTS